MKKKKDVCNECKNPMNVYYYGMSRMSVCNYCYISNKAKKEVFDDIEKAEIIKTSCENIIYPKLKKRHLSTFAKSKSNIIADKAKSAKNVTKNKVAD